jgi:hypothetical protein
LANVVTVSSQGTPVWRGAMITMVLRRAVPKADGLAKCVQWRCRGSVHKAANKGLSSSVETSEEALLVSDDHLARLCMDRGILPLLEMVELVINSVLCVRK